MWIRSFSHFFSWQSYGDADAARRLCPSLLPFSWNDEFDVRVLQCAFAIFPLHLQATNYIEGDDNAKNAMTINWLWRFQVQINPFNAYVHSIFCVPVHFAETQQRTATERSTEMVYIGTPIRVNNFLSIWSTTYTDRVLCFSFRLFVVNSCATELADICTSSSDPLCTAHKHSNVAKMMEISCQIVVLSISSEEWIPLLPQQLHPNSCVVNRRCIALHRIEFHNPIETTINKDIRQQFQDEHTFYILVNS